MAQVLIWGKARELVAGDLPPGLPSEEVESLAALQASLDGRGAALVLADPSRLAAEHEALEAWLRAGGSFQAVLVVVAEPRDGEEVLRRFPFVDDLVARPLTPARLRLRLERALQTVHNRRVIRQLEATVTRRGNELHELNKIGVALSAERDIDKLLELILQKSREITGADAGSLYLVERGKERGETSDDRLRFKLTQNDSVMIPFEEFTMPLDGTSIAGYTALSGRIVNVPDAYRLRPDSPYRWSRGFDEQSGYRTKSLLVVPMRDHENAVIGVVQLINKKRDRATILTPVSIVDEQVIAFTSVDEELAESLASQAAVAFENAKLLQDIRHLFDAFVHAAVTTIEQRDPTTSGHSERVAVLTVALAERVDAVSTGELARLRFTRDQLEELRYAGLLHDFGKVGVKDSVLIKGKKLYGRQLDAIRERFAYIKRTAEVEYLRAKLERVLAGERTVNVLADLDDAHAAKQRELDRLLDLVMAASEPTVVEERSFGALMDLPARTFPDLDGELRPFLTQEELASLRIPKGSLTEEEREQIQSHVTHTYAFLSQIPWTSEFRRIPEIAWAHHEKLDGSGYPRRLTAPDIPVQSRMMTISDIYDALVAWDRPYKRAVAPERALDILAEDARHGRIDGDLLAVFIESGVWEITRPRP
jgi:HD-GYP domain-containing protein (c-di-GMP phosphodiesterase class II)